MGQYHNIVSIDRREFLQPHLLGCGLKAWEQLGGGIPAALTWLLAANPGNMPADLSGDYGGAWAGTRVAAFGDYAEDSDMPDLPVGLTASGIYQMCESKPEPRSYRNAAETEAQYKRNAKRECLQDTAEWQQRRAAGELFEDLTIPVRGIVEEGASVRYCGSGWLTEVPVLAYAQKNAKGEIHYDLIEMSKDDRGYYRRMCGIKDTARNPSEAGLSRWPWDRPPSNHAWRGISDWKADQGQARVFINLDKREFFDPLAFGEQSTTAGIMRACTGHKPIMSLDAIVMPDGVRIDHRFGKSDFSSAALLTAMLFHPETRGGGDISMTEFPEVGRWRGDRIALTSAYSSEKLPSTTEARDSFHNIGALLSQAAVKLAA